MMSWQNLFYEWGGYCAEVLFFLTWAMVWVCSLKWWARRGDRGAVWVVIGSSMCLVQRVFLYAVLWEWIPFEGGGGVYERDFWLGVDFVFKGGGELLIALGLWRYFRWRPVGDDVFG